MSKEYLYSHWAVGVPAYGRKHVRGEEALSFFTRGFNVASDIPERLRFFSIRDCAPGCVVTLKYGLKLQKSITYTVPTKEQIILARLQNLHPFPSDNDVREALGGFRPTRSLLGKWIHNDRLYASIVQVVIKVR